MTTSDHTLPSMISGDTQVLLTWKLTEYLDIKHTWNLSFVTLCVLITKSVKKGFNQYIALQSVPLC